MEQQQDARDLHVPVLRDTCVELLLPAFQVSDPVAIDGTLGMGGHAEALLSAQPNLRLIGIDRDRQALQLAGDRLARFGDRFVPFHGEYDRVDEVAREFGRRGQVDGILLDLGVSSLQLDDPERGFAYSRPAPLDMRMDQSSGQSAAELLATAPVGELTRILREYGEEKFARKIAQAIVRRRETEMLTTTAELAELVKDVIPAPARRTGGNPAKRTFQALRIAVNDELGILERTLPRALDSLRVGGRLVVESYQSLEDRIVKRTLAQGLKDTAPPGLPVVPEANRARLRALVKGALKADPTEVAQNPRSQSVRLRAVELVAPWSQS
ncbi:16S rRNA (cytosine(1402)-N(4))-methyltransferase RsmH [Scrofimicrobium sp. R131]|uniref:Ribosomal RNA small subunit methyltransferase H n=1 Tax=Scrofimicrobium appendicitidis TaxID=3079930 RepID=A0AAU7V6A9_9ACTO